MMDIKTGEIHVFNSKKELEACRKKMKQKGQALLTLRRLPKESCPKCYGRGYTGRLVKTGDVIPCSCCVMPIDRALKIE